VNLLADYERKRGRAKTHLNVLRVGLQRITRKKLDPIKGELQPNGTQYEFRLPPDRFDPEWQLLIGDFAYNMRASLDYLITALVRSTGKQENKGNEFPIYSPPFGNVTWANIHDWWDTTDKVRGQLQNTPPETRAALKQLQPFYGVPATDPFRHPLKSLYELNNRDKHRSLNLIARAATIKFVDASGKPLFQDLDWPVRSSPSKGNEGHTPDVFLTLNVPPGHADVDVYLLATEEVAFHQPPELIGEVIETLAGIQQFIDSRVLPVVRSLL
jgi:hypothetical protein